MPHGVVVVRTVESEQVEPRRLTDRVRPALHERRNGSSDHAPEHRDLHAQLVDHVVELGDGLVGSVHGNDTGRRHAIGQAGEAFGRVDVVGPAGDAAGLVVGNAGGSQADGGVEDREVETQLLHPFGQQIRHHGRGPISGVAGRDRPPGLVGQVAVAALLARQPQVSVDFIAEGCEALCCLLAANPP